MVTWEDCRNLFEPDGSLIDLYVMAAGLPGWNSFLSIAREAGAKFSVDNQPRAFPSSAKEVFTLGKEANTYLAMNWEGLLINAHFFNEEELELDLDPREVDSPRRFKSLIAFMRRLADATTMTVILTPENCSEKPFLEVYPGNDEIKTRRAIDGTQHSA